MRCRARFWCYRRQVTVMFSDLVGSTALSARMDREDLRQVILGLSVICIDARHARAVLKMQINKSDRNDAAGIARIMQTGWFKEVRVKDVDSHSIRALLASRALL
jgi:hypothetical protein